MGPKQAEARYSQYGHHGRGEQTKDDVHRGS